MSTATLQFLVLKLIRVSPASRAIIFPELIPHVPRLINHREASGILEDAYALWCTAKERTAMMRQFWGKEMLLWSECVAVWSPALIMLLGTNAVMRCAVSQ